MLTRSFPLGFMTELIKKLICVLGSAETSKFQAVEIAKMTVS